MGSGQMVSDGLYSRHDSRNNNARLPCLQEYPYRQKWHQSVWKCSIPLQELWCLSRAQAKTSVFGNRATDRAASLSRALQPPWNCTDLCHGTANDCAVVQRAYAEIA